MKLTIVTNEQELKDLKLIRKYFGDHDVTQIEHMAFDVLNNLIRKFQEAANSKQLKEEEQDSTLTKAIKKWGAMPQIKMYYEESAELTQALCKIDRLNGISGDKIIEPNKDTDIKYSLAYHALCGEIADVEIILAQLRKMVNSETVDLIKERKINRLEKRINNSDFEGK